LEPVFVGGADRSGTSLVASLLGAHSGIVAIPEAQFLARHLRDVRLARKQGSPGPAFVSSFDNYRLRLWNLPEPAADAVEGLDSAAAMRHLVSIFANQRGIDSNTLHAWVDHTPSNLHNWGVLDEIFPASKFIHIVRDGRAVAHSLKSMRWGPNDVEASAQWWLSRLATAVMCELALGSDRVLRVRFEDLLAGPSSVLESICAFLKIEFEASMIEGGGYQLPDYWNHGHGLVSRSPDASRIAAWTQELAPADIERFESIAGPALEFFGYPLEYAGGARPSGNIERFRRGFAEFAKFYVINPPRHFVEISRAVSRVRRNARPSQRLREDDIVQLTAAHDR
jgi:Sulfotransferase family